MGQTEVKNKNKNKPLSKTAWKRETYKEMGNY